MTRIRLAVGVADDVRRFTEHLLAHDAADISERIDEIFDALALLGHHPSIGRPASRGRRELVIGKGSRGSVARYEYDPIADVVTVLAIRAQRERRYARR